MEGDRRRKEAAKVEEERRAKAAEDARVRQSMEDARRQREVEVSAHANRTAARVPRNNSILGCGKANSTGKYCTGTVCVYTCGVGASALTLRVWRHVQQFDCCWFFPQAKRKKAEEEARKRDAEKAAKVRTPGNTQFREFAVAGRPGGDEPTIRWLAFWLFLCRRRSAKT